MNNRTSYSTDLFKTFPIALLVTKQNKEIVFANEKLLKILGRPLQEIKGNLFSLVFPHVYQILPKNWEVERFINLQFNNKNYLLQIAENESYQYYFFYNEGEIDELLKRTELYQNLYQDLKAIFENTYDVIYVSDGDGKTMRVSSASERLWGLKKEELIGKSAYELEKKGVYKPSITRLVLEQGKQIQTIQNTKTGRRLLVIGTPIKNNEGKITRVINTSRDITDIDKLKSELDATRRMMTGYMKESKSLRLQQQNNQQFKVISRSVPMKNIMALTRKVAEVNSTLLIYGESGVGKEMIARHIHEQDDDAETPFITVNCAALPEKLLEEELFGKEGSNNNGILKDTYRGTLLIDAVDELSLVLQSKLFQLLTKMKMETNRDANRFVRIIAITNQDLNEKVREGLFRKDLFYFLNVIPIHIPPLRDRKDDILPLILLFVRHFNQLYSMNKQFSNEMIDSLLDYSWPGNVRELRNLVERLIVTSQSKIITKKDLPQHLQNIYTHDDIVSLSQIIPMRTALEETEKQLIQLAMTKYKTTTQIAKALHVNQSTISRKINKYFD